MKKICAILISICFIFSLSAIDMHSMESSLNQTTTVDVVLILLKINDPYMTVNGVKSEIDPGRGTTPLIKNGRTLIPIRAVIETLQGTMTWKASERKVSIIFPYVTIQLWIDKTKALMNQIDKQMDVSPSIINGRTMVPIRFVAENIGCKVDWNSSKSTITLQKITLPPIDQKIDEKTNKIPTIGGEVVLLDGAKIVFQNGSFSSSTTVSVKKVINPMSYGKNTIGYDIDGLSNLKKDVKMTIPMEKMLDAEAVVVNGCNPENEKLFTLTHQFNKLTGIVTITLPFQGQTKIQSEQRGFLEKLKVLVTKVVPYIPKAPEFLIRMPFYAQSGGSCWASSALMLTRAYNTDPPGSPMNDVMRYCRTSETDYGIDNSTFTNVLPFYIQLASNGRGVEWRGFTSVQHLQWEMMRQLENNHSPMLLRYPGHAVLVVGYQNRGTDFIIHDPQDMMQSDATNGTMYTIRNKQWFASKKINPLSALQILWITDSVPEGRTLQTIGCPILDEHGGTALGEIGFFDINPNTKHDLSVASLGYKGSGSHWISPGLKSVDTVSSNAQKLKLDLPIWNAYFGATSVTIKIQVNTGSTKVYSWTCKETILKSAAFNQSTKQNLTREIKMEDIRDVKLGDSKGIQPVTIYVDLIEGGDVKDNFFVSTQLSLLPVVTKVFPSNAKPGETIQILGNSFGKNKSLRSKIILAGEEAKIESWSEKEIRVKVPINAENGPVIVKTGNNFEYTSNSDVMFNAKKLDRSGSWEMQCSVPYFDAWDCKIKNTHVFTLCIKIKNSIVSASGPTCYSHSQEVTGTCDDNGNVSFSFKWVNTQDSVSGYVITGQFTGHYVGTTYYLDGIANGKTHVWGKNSKYCGTYDKEFTFSEIMRDKGYKPK